MSTTEKNLIHYLINLKFYNNLYPNKYILFRNFKAIGTFKNYELARKEAKLNSFSTNTFLIVKNDVNMKNVKLVNEELIKNEEYYLKNEKKLKRAYLNEIILIINQKVFDSYSSYDEAIIAVNDNNFKEGSYIFKNLKKKKDLKYFYDYYLNNKILLEKKYANSYILFYDKHIEGIFENYKNAYVLASINKFKKGSYGVEKGSNLKSSLKEHFINKF